jgi:hypothetical protein
MNKIVIAILQRGWVFVGELSKEGSECTLSNAYNIRRWGTSEGLGELAAKGPLEETKLDKVGTVSFHELTTVALIDCDQDVWSKALAA